MTWEIGQFQTMILKCFQKNKQERRAKKKKIFFKCKRVALPEIETIIIKTRSFCCKNQQTEWIMTDVYIQVVVFIKVII